MSYKKSFQIILLSLVFCQLLLSVNAQQILSLESALDIARSNSPDIRRSILNLERSKQSLKAQNAALKSKFSLNLTPYSYDMSRSFYDFYSTWNTSKSTQSFGTFTVSQPILPTAGTISLINRFSWQNNYSEFNNTRSKTFSNNLYLSVNQPLFTYNRTKLELKSLELDLENAQLSYDMQKLNLEKQVTQFFYNVYLEQMKLTIANDELANTQRSLEIIQKIK